MCFDSLLIEARRRDCATRTTVRCLLDEAVANKGTADVDDFLAFVRIADANAETGAAFEHAIRRLAKKLNMVVNPNVRWFCTICGQEDCLNATEFEMVGELEVTTL